MGSIGNIKDILSVKIKARHDSYTDQFVRIFMTKMFMISALVMGVDFFNDKVSCIVPKTSNLGADFVHSACWIQGFYIYPEMAMRMKDSRYYGMPRDIIYDGMLENGVLCKTGPTLGQKCKPMQKTFYLQHQWMPFFIASLALMHYFPYLLFRIVNTDIISLKTSLKGEVSADSLVRNYFNYKINSKTKMRIRIFLNLVIKSFYITVCCVGFWLIDLLHNGNFKSYGPSWIRWTKYNNSASHDFQEMKHPKPGNVLLPPMGICEIAESYGDSTHSMINHNKFVCEISPNILYQYVLIMLWFLIVFSIIVSISGLIISLVGHLVTVTCFLNDGNPAREIYQILTFRECEYLEMIRRRNIPLFGDIVRTLLSDRSDCKCKGTFNFPQEKNFNQELLNYDHRKLEYRSRTQSFA
ncbi:uncharacterized protein LOC100202445 [Hydra vulgaris]|uniref:uncharacterized protein LOC100202445 n=1 Tax=Hydra vulgaris TaxID=6087 RepID=UPI001F5EF64E|nr:uncharacterized protein LOC100202445 [Hydra vulgaris]